MNVQPREERLEKKPEAGRWKLGPGGSAAAGAEARADEGEIHWSTGAELLLAGERTWSGQEDTPSIAVSERRGAERTFPLTAALQYEARCFGDCGHGDGDGDGDVAMTS
ncbi:hypothetical protein AXG93_3114s1130 [Marchantia polymorpha subsp. ruderalis]|uniref:Uncharacterized protein n=1 Tax=Marchantia polymorpha subsp. ruderalis TaxID=1480154 RepID=A0A176W858_MARPO|nr:hypothetical protein AXG93_3114s1130 [Marchantia polymorpha subsp. ruderalis]